MAIRRPGIVGTLQLAATLVFALPALLFGLERLAAGRLLVGGAFVALAVIMLLLQRHLTNPFDPGDVAEAALDRVTDDDDRGD